MEDYEKFANNFFDMMMKAIREYNSLYRRHEKLEKKYIEMELRLDSLEREILS